MLDFEPPKISVERSFCQDGFVVIPGMFDRSSVQGFRRAAQELLPLQKPPYKSQFSNTALFSESLRGVFLNSKLIETLRGLFGDDFVFVNEFALHDSFYSGWHTDTSSSEGKSGHNFMWSPGFYLANVAIYLQDNLDTGGGLDAVPRSHLLDDPVAMTIRKEKDFPPDYRSEYTDDPYADGRTLRTKAGDVVIFNLRASHRSSVATREPTTEADRKMAIFLMVGPNNTVTHRYREWINEYDEMNKAKRADIPEEFKSFLSGLNLSVI